MRQYSTDYRLWVVLFWPAFIGLGFLRDPFDPGSRSLWNGLSGWIARGGGEAHEGGMMVMQTAAAIPLAIGIGWIAQGVGQFFGLRLGGQPGTSNAGDYDDAPPS